MYCIDNSNGKLQFFKMGLGNCILNLLTFGFVSMEVENDDARPEYTIV